MAAAESFLGQYISPKRCILDPTNVLLADRKVTPRNPNMSSEFTYDVISARYDVIDVFIYDRLVFTSPVCAIEFVIAGSCSGPQGIQICHQNLHDVIIYEI